MKKIALMSLIILALGMLVGCGNSTSTGSSGGGQTVTMGATTFDSQSVTVSKGSTLTLVDDATNGTPHILVIGKNGSPDDEAGAADFNGATGHSFQPGQSWTTPAWTTPGTYYVTCTLHPTTMTLTVIVSG